ncbi:DUF4367 domain-containing protein [Paenibacillus sp. HB172176]|uniref:DUF4367 domain-containing protein n=1 Tax=Paenibacillus sp. HB172176 TaxID=2493690 RepID=UPI00143C6AFE|nr:DUF4367 domain-containing protein [Paenibacillus sp. HB172176]
MTKEEEAWKQKYQAESNETLFQSLQFDSRLKNEVRKRIEAESEGEYKWAKRGWMTMLYKKWMYAVAAGTAALLLILALPMFQGDYGGQPDNNNSGITSPADGTGDNGSSLSSLITTEVQTPEEAKSLYGSQLLTPSYMPEGYQLIKIEAVGMDANHPTRVLYTYTSGELLYTVMQSKENFEYPLDMFKSTEINGVHGFVHASPGITELVWTVDGDQFTITGPLSEADAMKVAESMQ